VSERDAVSTTTSWVSAAGRAHERALESRLTEVLSAPARVVAAPPADAGAPWRLTLEVHGLTVHIHGPNHEGPRWFEASGLSFSYARTAAGVDPYETPEGAQRLNALREQARAAELSWLGGALETLWSFSGLRDEALYQVSMGRGRPYGIIRLGFGCNQDCAFCWQSRSWPEPDTETCRSWIDEMAKSGVSNLLLSGGEPTTYKDLPELVSYAVTAHGMEVGLETNAIRFRKGRVLEDLMARGLTKALISLHSADPTVSDAMTRAAGTWTGTVAGTEAALDAGLLVALNCVIDRDNVEGLEEHARFVVERFASRPRAQIHQVIYSHPSSAWDTELYESKQISLERIRPGLVAASRILLDAGLTVSTGGSCGFPPCVVSEEPRLAMPSNPEEFDTADLSGRAHGTVCERCSAQSTCLGVRNEYLAQFGERGLRAI
jgi:pyruvate-formate lyase-activating enzyme